MHPGLGKVTRLPDVRVLRAYKGSTVHRWTLHIPHTPPEEIVNALPAGTFLTVLDDTTYILSTTTGPTTPATRTPIRVPHQVAERVRRHRKATGQSVTQQLMDAFDHHYDTIATAREGLRQALGARGVGARRRRGVGPTAQLWLTLTPAQKEVLDAAARATYSGNRSAMATELLERDHIATGI